MGLVATILGGAALEHSWVSFREVVNPLKMVTNVCFCVHCIFFMRGCVALSDFQKH